MCAFIVCLHGAASVAKLRQSMVFSNSCLSGRFASGNEPVAVGKPERVFTYIYIHTYMYEYVCVHNHT